MEVVSGRDKAFVGISEDPARAEVPNMLFATPEVTDERKAFYERIDHDSLAPLAGRAAMAPGTGSVTQESHLEPDRCHPSRGRHFRAYESQNHPSAEIDQLWVMRGT